MENLRKHRDVELAVTEARKNYLVSEPNYHITIFFFFFFPRKFVSYRNEKNTDSHE